jgi:hypothetical protein
MSEENVQHKIQETPKDASHTIHSITDSEIETAALAHKSAVGGLHSTSDLPETLRRSWLAGARWYRDEVRKRWPAYEMLEAELTTVEATKQFGRDWGVAVEACYELLRSRVLGDTDTKGGGG